jgi:membrane-bound serine protease (ClpP class)
MDKKKSSIRPWLITFLAVFDDVMILALIVLILFLIGVKLPVPVLVILGLAVAAGLFFLHRLIVQSLKRRLISGAEGMIGVTGRVIEALEPEGSVIIKGEYWKAFSPFAKIAAGSEIEVTGIKGLTLEVKEKSRD